MTHRFSHRAEYFAMLGAIRALRLVPLSWARRIGALFGLTTYVLGIRRQVVLQQLAMAFPDHNPRSVRHLARRAYAHLGRMTVETALLPYLGRKGILDMVESTEGFEAIEAAFRAGRGVVLITGHLGNWELAGSYVAARGLPIEVIVRGMSNKLVEAYVNQTRHRAGMQVVLDRDAVRRVPRAFREGHGVAFVADQGVLRLASTFVPFFGRLAKTPRGPAVFALRFELPAFFVALVRTESQRYRWVSTPVEVASTGNREADVDAMVAAYTRILEDWVRRYPDQYFWHHRRWRRQPDDSTAELSDPVDTVPRAAGGSRTSS